jgi:hypothetical protein
VIDQAGQIVIEEVEEQPPSSPMAASSVRVDSMLGHGSEGEGRRSSEMEDRDSRDGQDEQGEEDEEFGPRCLIGEKVWSEGSEASYTDAPTPGSVDGLGTGGMSGVELGAEDEEGRIGGGENGFTGADMGDGIQGPARGIQGQEAFADEAQGGLAEVKGVERLSGGFTLLVRHSGRMLPAATKYIGERSVGWSIDLTQV